MASAALTPYERLSSSTGDLSAANVPQYTGPTDAPAPLYKKGDFVIFLYTAQLGVVHQDQAFMDDVVTIELENGCVMPLRTQHVVKILYGQTLTRQRECIDDIQALKNTDWVGFPEFKSAVTKLHMFKQNSDDILFKYSWDEHSERKLSDRLDAEGLEWSQISVFSSQGLLMFQCSPSDLDDMSVFPVTVRCEVLTDVFKEQVLLDQIEKVLDIFKTRQGKYVGEWIKTDSPGDKRVDEHDMQQGEEDSRLTKGIVDIMGATDNEEWRNEVKFSTDMGRLQQILVRVNYGWSLQSAPVRQFGLVVVPAGWLFREYFVAEYTCEVEHSGADSLCVGNENGEVVFQVKCCLFDETSKAELVTRASESSPDDDTDYMIHHQPSDIILSPDIIKHQVEPFQDGEDHFLKIIDDKTSQRHTMKAIGERRMMQPPQNTYGGTIDAAIRASNGDGHGARPMVVAKLLSVYFCQFRMLVYIRDLVNAEFLDNPAAFSKERFQSLKVGIFLGIFAAAIFSSLCDWLNNVKILTRGHYVRINNGVEEYTQKPAIKPMLRALLFFFVLLPEFFIFISVLYWGSMYLIISKDVETLILNCTALVFLTELDEIFYRADSTERKHVQVVIIARASQATQDVAFNWLVIIVVSAWSTLLQYYIQVVHIHSLSRVCEVVFVFALVCFFSCLAHKNPRAGLRQGLAFCFVMLFLYSLVQSWSLGVNQAGSFWAAGGLWIPLLVLILICMCLCCPCTIIGIVIVGLVLTFQVVMADIAADGIHHAVLVPGVWPAPGTGACSEGLLTCELDEKKCIESRIDKGPENVWTALYSDQCPQPETKKSCHQLNRDHGSHESVKHDSKADSDKHHSKSGSHQLAARWRNLTVTNSASCYDRHEAANFSKTSVHFEAKGHCRDRSARLCTLRELHEVTDKADGGPFWSVVPCITPKGVSGYWQHTPGQKPVCADIHEKASTTCCADSPQCQRDTGHTCLFVGCGQHLGTTTCVVNHFWEKKCVCTPGYCVVDGVCKPHLEPMDAELDDEQAEKGSEDEKHEDKSSEEENKQTPNDKDKERHHDDQQEVQSGSREARRLGNEIDDFASIVAFISGGVTGESTRSNVDKSQKQDLISVALMPQRDLERSSSLLIAWRAYAKGHSSETELWNHFKLISSHWQVRV